MTRLTNLFVPVLLVLLTEFDLATAGHRRPRGSIRRSLTSKSGKGSGKGKGEMVSDTDTTVGGPELVDSALPEVDDSSGSIPTKAPTAASSSPVIEVGSGQSPPKGFPPTDNHSSYYEPNTPSPVSSSTDGSPTTKGKKGNDKETPAPSTASFSAMEGAPSMGPSKAPGGKNKDKDKETPAPSTASFSAMEGAPSMGQSKATGGKNKGKNKETTAPSTLSFSAIEGAPSMGPSKAPDGKNKGKDKETPAPSTASFSAMEGAPGMGPSKAPGGKNMGKDKETPAPSTASFSAMEGAPSMGPSKAPSGKNKGKDKETPAPSTASFSATEGAPSMGQSKAPGGKNKGKDKETSAPPPPSFSAMEGAPSISPSTTPGSKKKGKGKDKETSAPSPPSFSAMEGASSMAPSNPSGKNKGKKQKATSSQAPVSAAPTKTPPPTDPPLSSPSDIPKSESLASNVPSDLPSMAPSDLPSVMNVESYIQDPKDPKGLVCPEAINNSSENLETATTSTVPVDFEYQLWIADGYNLTTVRYEVEEKLTEQVANVLLTCNKQRRRRLVKTEKSNLFGISAQPGDMWTDSCGDGCHLMEGRMTIKVIEEDETPTEKETSNLVNSCAVLAVLQESSTMTNVATSTKGVEAIRYESSEIPCFIGGSLEQEGETSSNNINSDNNNSDNTLGAGPSVAIALTSGLLLVGLLAVARTARSRDETYNSLQLEDKHSDDGSVPAGDDGVSLAFNSTVDEEEAAKAIQLVPSSMDGSTAASISYSDDNALMLDTAMMVPFDEVAKGINPPSGQKLEYPAERGDTPHDTSHSLSFSSPAKYNSMFVEPEDSEDEDMRYIGNLMPSPRHQLGNLTSPTASEVSPRRDAQNIHIMESVDLFGDDGGSPERPLTPITEIGTVASPEPQRLPNMLGSKNGPTSQQRIELGLGVHALERQVAHVSDLSETNGSF